MSTFRIVAFTISALASACTTSTPEPQPPPPPAPAQDAPSASAAPALDLSTPEKARATIYEVLRRDDKEAFKRCVSKRVLERQNDQFDTWYAVWKAAADKGPPEKFQKIGVTQEDGVYKLDEN
ncbi:hypothetical protein [Polyangium jinanense]|uniref:Lipoprotein n=1 Tax=Polyangium jinanense TaxID=2829994 RepID=A0A9X3XCC0_9BACT|nr:hypothetical protein [Polyangium jinanense]MDC3958992.1 hypothetical protein [Polyangium jinanense]MDC3986383.1 hypothetical protein [Polyangium jinanense]